MSIRRNLLSEYSRNNRALGCVAGHCTDQAAQGLYGSPKLLEKPQLRRKSWSFRNNTAAISDIEKANSATL